MEIKESQKPEPRLEQSKINSNPVEVGKIWLCVTCANAFQLGPKCPRCGSGATVIVNGADTNVQDELKSLKEE